MEKVLLWLLDIVGLCPSSHGSQGSDLLMTFGKNPVSPAGHIKDVKYRSNLQMVMVNLMMNPQWSSKTCDHPRLLGELPHHGHMLLVRVPGQRKWELVPANWQSGYFDSVPTPEINQYIQICQQLRKPFQFYQLWPKVRFTQRRRSPEKTFVFRKERLRKRESGTC